MGPQPLRLHHGLSETLCDNGRHLRTQQKLLLWSSLLCSRIDMQGSAIWLYSSPPEVKAGYWGQGYDLGFTYSPWYETLCLTCKEEPGISRVESLKLGGRQGLCSYSLSRKGA